MIKSFIGSDILCFELCFIQNELLSLEWNILQGSTDFYAIHDILMTQPCSQRTIWPFDVYRWAPDTILELPGFQ